MLIFLILASLFSLNFCDVCKMKLSTGESINLSKISQQSVDLSACEQDHHTLVFEVCKELADSTCPSTNTDGPGNACDDYDKIPTTSYYWVGGLDNMDTGGYKDDAFTITYNGIPQPKNQGWTRSMEMTCSCNHKVEHSVSCTGVVQGTSLTTYQIKLESKYCCPSTSGYNFFWVVLGVGGIIWIIMCCYFCLYLCAGGIVFIIMKANPKTRSNEVCYYPPWYCILGFPVVLYCGWFQLQGWFILIDAVLFLKAKIKKEEYTPFRY